MANIYKLTEDVMEVQNICLSEDIDLTDEEFGQLLDATFSTFGSLEEKFTAYGKVIKNLMAEGEALKTEKQLLQKRESSIANQVARLKDSLHQSMSITGVTKVDGIPKVSLAKNPPSIDRANLVITAVDEKWLAPPADRTLDSRKVMDHFKETGEAPKGIAIITDRTSVRIR